jgi:glycerol kinase
MVKDGAALKQLGVDGGMVVNDWLCQFLADILNVKVERPVIIETTALGAAHLAALGAGVVSSLQDRPRVLDRDFVPNMPDAQRAALMAGWQAAVAQALAGTD